MNNLGAYIGGVRVCHTAASRAGKDKSDYLPQSIIILRIKILPMRDVTSQNHLHLQLTMLGGNTIIDTVIPITVCLGQVSFRIHFVVEYVLT